MAQRPFSRLYPHDHLMKYTVIPFIPVWLRPNHFTVFRMFLTPFIVWLLYIGELRVGIPLFVFAAFTDVIDGSLARLRKQITPWGIFFDPVADKLLVGCVALTIALQYFNPALVFVAIALDLLPATLFLARKNPRTEITGANVWGKAKMVLQFISLTLLLFGILFAREELILAGEAVLGISLGFALIAAVTYSL